MADQDNPQKKIVAIGRAVYRGYTILETATCFTVQLGTQWVSSRSLTALTVEIDKWLALKLN